MNTVDPMQTVASKEFALIDDRFEMVRELGSGSVGAVYLVKDRHSSRAELALKLLYPHLVSDKDTLRRFKREVRLCRSLSHPCVAQIYEFQHRSDECCYYTMEYVSGQTLAELLANAPNGRMPTERAVYIGWQILAALAASHAQQIVHRDIKPQNILITPSGQVKLTDFGLACLVEDDSGGTKPGTSLGTPYYMSPEQFRGERVDYATDLYAFGIVLFELLTGVRPFRASVYYQLAIEHLTLPVPDLPSLATEIPQWLQTVVNACLRKEPRKRPRSTAQLAQQFLSHLHESFAPEAKALVCAARARLRRRAARTWTRRILEYSFALAIAASVLGVLTRNDPSTYRSIGIATLRLERLIGTELNMTRSLLGLRVSHKDCARLANLVLHTSGDTSAYSDAYILIHSGSVQQLSQDNRDEVVHAICRQGYEYLLQGMLPYSNAYQTLDAFGSACIHYGAERELPLLLSVLSSTKMRSDARDVAGDTAWHILSRAGFSEGLYQLSHGFSNPRRAALALRNNRGETPLELALTSQNVDFGGELVRLGADLEQPFSDGTIPRDWCINHNRPDILDLTGSDDA